MLQFIIILLTSSVIVGQDLPITSANCADNRDQTSCLHSNLANCAWCTTNSRCLTYNPCSQTYIDIYQTVNCTDAQMAEKTVPCPSVYHSFWFLIIVYIIIAIIFLLCIFGTTIKCWPYTIVRWIFIAASVIWCLTYATIVITAIVYASIGYDHANEIEVQQANNILGWGLLFLLALWPILGINAFFCYWFIPMCRHLPDYRSYRPI